jgi:hypothetical protein
MLWDEMLIANGTIPEQASAALSGTMGPWRRRGLIVLCWLAAVSLGAVHTWAARHSMNADGMSYLDLADAWRNLDAVQAWRTGQWTSIANAYWSPLYSWLLAAGLAIARPTPYWEAAVAHLVNFAGYLVALAYFHYFWMGLRRQVEQRRQATGRADETVFPEWAWILLGYGLCVWILLDWITIDIVTPDMYVAAFVFLDVGLLVRIRGGATGWGTFLVLGLSLGLGYLTKAILLPMAAVFMVTILLAAPHRLRVIPRLVLTLAVFATLASPWACLLTKAKGRFTMGDAGKMNYAGQVNGFYPWDVWQGDAPPPGCGKPKHPVRQLLDKPAVFEFTEPVGGTYPVWYDPSYWHDGVEPRLDLRQQPRVLSEQLSVYLNLFCREMGLITFPLLLLLFVRSPRAGTLRSLASMWWLALPALAALGAYGLVHVESRYVGPFILMLWAAILPAVGLPRCDTSNRVIGCAAVAMLSGVLLLVGHNAWPACKEACTDARNHNESRLNPHWLTAQAMAEAGLRPGEQVGHVGQAVRSWSYWARLAGVRITAELRPSESFWLGDDATRARVLSVFTERTPVKAVVTREQTPNERPFGLPYDFAPGWEPVGNTRFYIRFLGRPISPSVPQPSTQPIR